MYVINDHVAQVANQSSVGEDEDDWGSDTAEDTQQRIEELTDAAKKLMASEELEKTTEERLEMFYKFVEVLLDVVTVLLLLICTV